MAVWLAQHIGDRPRGGDRYRRPISAAAARISKCSTTSSRTRLRHSGPGSSDLVCSRMTLFHLVGKQEQALRQMGKCLGPGPWLVEEDADWGRFIREADSRRWRAPDLFFCESAAAARTLAMRRNRKPVGCGSGPGSRAFGMSPMRSLAWVGLIYQSDHPGGRAREGAR